MARDSTPDNFETAGKIAAYGDVLLDLLRTDDDFSRTLVRHQYPHQNGANLEDTGAVPRETRCQMIFFSRGNIAAIQALDDFRGQVDGKPKKFVHPLIGTYDAMVEDFQVTATAENRDWIEAECTFVEQGVKDPVFFLPQVTVTLEDVKDANAAVTAELNKMATANTAAIAANADALSKAEGWTSSSSQLTQREINLQLNEASNAINAAAEDLEIALDPDGYPMLIAWHRLNYELRNLARQVIDDSPSTTTHKVLAATSVISIASTIYGGEAATVAAERILELNDLSSPGLVPAGTILVIEDPEQ